MIHLFLSIGIKPTFTQCLPNASARKGTQERLNSEYGFGGVYGG